MKYSIVALLTLLAATTSTADVPQNAASFAQELMGIEFHSWTEQHGKLYNTPHEKELRFQVWQQNHDLIEAHNHQKPTPSYELGHNEYSDMTHDEFLTYHRLGQPIVKSDRMEAADPELAAQLASSLEEQLTLPDYVNWIANGGVTPVKNQGACGSCWAFSTTGALEGAKFIRTGELVGLSEQNLLDCDHKDLGCSGGLMDNAFKFDEKSGGLCSEEDYPYVAKQGSTCKTDCTDVPGSIVKTFVDVPPGNARALLAGIAMQPISIAIQAGQFPFQFYKKGVLDDDSCGRRAEVDHGVLAVGYGTDLETQTPYWLVKNSWGETWGETGYVRIARNSTNEFGMCAILKMASFPVVEAP
eukprot:CAMPEP_0119010412 /NCGR_PEP_ID=MMETSP1176-20130426/4986_1 /TAXON_ID=265551 /ORGANISM="Synedropsis recta cf, Strain CCMP1620" /LENGTH=356 /DNA_ID=CAMNT_0006963065 /DNA_START=110 /DNA_END=1180 /DNA_ORIENTATION=+